MSEIDGFIFSVMGKPIAKARPRFSKRGKFVKVYNSQKKEEKVFGLKALKAFTAIGGKKISGPVSLNVTSYIKRPKSHYRTGRYANLLKDSAPKDHITKPDIDNLLKFVMDCLNNRIWYDDAQVTHGDCRKEYSEVEKTVIEIYGESE